METEKLIIDSEKIIHILLKQLMYLKNENAYIRNKAGLNSLDDEALKNNIGAKPIINDAFENKIGANSLSNEASKNNIGANSIINDALENKMGANSLYNEASKNNIGAKHLINDAPENKVGDKSVFEALPALNGKGNTEIMLYTVFEQGLISALEQYIKTGDGQKTLYNYYAGFVEAVTDKNMEAAKMKEAAKNVILEDTHILPELIQIDVPSLEKLKVALYGHLPRTAMKDLYENVAYELFYLHNFGKATGTELRKSGILSKPGFTKHLTKLKEYGLIKKQPPSNYVLTENSKHILLKLFGVPKK